MRILLTLLVPALLTAPPALAARNRLTGIVELTYTPRAERHPFGVGVGVEAAASTSQRSEGWSPPPVDANAGAAIRLRAHGDGSVDFAIEPIIGLIGGAPSLLCGMAFPMTGSVDFRPGLVLRSRGGPGVSLGAAATGVYQFLPLRAHASAVLPLRDAPRRAPRAGGTFEDFTVSLGSGMSIQTIGCLE